MNRARIVPVRALVALIAMSITSFSSEVIAQTASNGDGDVEQLKPVTAADPC